MKIKKSQIEVLFAVLKGTEGVVKLEEARIRDRFLTKLITEYELFQKERNEILEKFCEKDEEGNIKTTKDKDNNTIYHFPAENTELVNKELDILINEEVDVESNPFIKNIAEKTEYTPKIGEADIIDDIMKNI